MRLMRPFLLAGIPALAIVGALVWWLWGGRYISTENAYVKADIVQVSAEISGRVTEILVKEHALVKVGDPLLKIDPEPFNIALAKAEAELDQTRIQAAGLRVQYAEAVAELKESQNKIAFYDAQYARQISSSSVAPAMPSASRKPTPMLPRRATACRCCSRRSSAFLLVSRATPSCRTSNIRRCAKSRRCGTAPSSSSIERR